MNLNTLFAAIVETLATAVAAKISAAPPDYTSEAFTAAIDSKVQDAVNSYINDHEIDIESKVQDAIDEYDFTKEVKDAIRDTDFDVLLDINDKVESALADVDFSDHFDIEDAVSDAINDYDFSDKVADVINDMDLIDESRVRAIVREEIRAVFASFAASTEN